MKFSLYRRRENTGRHEHADPASLQPRYEAGHIVPRHRALALRLPQNHDGHSAKLRADVQATHEIDATIGRSSGDPTSLACWPYDTRRNKRRQSLKRMAPCSKVLDDCPQQGLVRFGT